MDLSQICVANLMQLAGGTELEIGMLRHMILNTIRFNNIKFRNDYGRLVLATDTRGKSWRKEAFPYYKANREKDRKESPIDWASYHKMVLKLQGELAVTFSYPLIAVDGAEGDDIIGVLAQYVAMRDEPVLILSGDKDFVQLQTNPLITQYSPVTKSPIFDAEPDFFLFEQICRGDRIDGVPNIRSADDCFVTGTRQTKIMTTEIHDWYTNAKTVPPELQDKYKRNRKLIDLNGTPVSIAKEVVGSYNAQLNKSTAVMSYFMDNQLQQLMRSISDFEENKDRQ